MLLLVGACLHFAQSLSFKADGSFKIVQLTDLHLGESAAKDTGTYRVRSSLLVRPADALCTPCIPSPPRLRAASRMSITRLAQVFTPRRDRPAAITATHCPTLMSGPPMPWATGSTTRTCIEAKGHAQLAARCLDLMACCNFGLLGPPLGLSGFCSLRADVPTSVARHVVCSLDS